MKFEQNGLEVAVIGISGRYPKCKDIDDFWQNLTDGVELTSIFSQSGTDAIDQTNKYKTIKAGAVLEDIELFDASFFGFNPKEAETMDPQHRLFLECAWEVLENAGYDSEIEERPIGVYAGVGMGTYLLHNLSPNRDLMKSQGFLPTVIGVDKDYLPTRVSYKLNLRGPSVSVGTACSSSLVAVHLAWQSLLNGECDMALAAGVSVKVPQNELTLSPGEIASPDGHCRAFSAEANGTIGGNGIGVVLLKRLEDAIADRDRIYAVIKGSAINNDGGAKIGYTAPSEEGQANVIRAAQVLSEVKPETISYVEAHGTGTSLGDPIEVAALTRAFRASTNKTGYCTLGSVKTNVGHLDAAAGITGLIKTILSLDRQSIPPSLNFKQPNPHIDFENSPFYVNTKLSEWKANGVPRRAGVSSFGVGGTNAHIILEEAPAVSAAPPKRSQELLLLSAKTPAALETVTVNLANYLKRHPKISLADVAYTLQVGRKAFDYRRTVVAESIERAINALDSVVSQQVSTQLPESEAPSVVFMFTGQGAQYVNMAQELYQNETIFRQECDRCCELLQPHLGFDLRSYLYPPEAEAKVAAERLKQTSITQPALFVIEYSLAKLWMSWGINPVAMIGHSIGEYVAATLAGVFELEDALSLIVARGRMMQQLPEGSMLSVGLSAEELEPLLNSELSLAASNSPKLSVVSGSTDAIALFKQVLQDREIDCRSLHTSHAFHSPMMDAIVEPFIARVAQLRLKQPQIPFISNLTGTWITAAEATNPCHWGEHLRQGVRFSAGIKKLLEHYNRIFLEIGPGRTLTTLAKQQAPQRVIISCLPHPKDKQSDSSLMLKALGKLWLNSVRVNWKEFSNHQQRYRVPLPTYPFERQRYWIDPPSELETQNGNGRQVVSKSQKRAKSNPQKNLADWFYVPKWQQSSVDPAKDDALLACTLVFVSPSGWGKQLIKQLQQQGKEAISVEIGSEFARLKDFSYSINPQQPHDYQTLLAELAQQNRTPSTIVHLWNVTSHDEKNLELKQIEQTQYRGFYSLMFLAQAIGSQNLTHKMQIIAAANQLQAVKTQDMLHPDKATLMGAVKVIPLEYPNITCRSIDLDVADTDGDRSEELWQELITNSDEQIIAYRDRQRWTQTFEPAKLEGNLNKAPKLREGGVYLITGGLGGIGLVLAEYLAKTVRAKLLLTGRSVLPDKADWTQWLTTHDRGDRISRKILKLQELERLGAETIVATADVNNLEQMELAIALAQKTWGNLNGIIHAAGVSGGGVIQRKSLENIEAVLAPKVSGTVVLDSLTKNTQLDFLVLCSSLASVLGGFGQADYVAANAFLDSFAHYRNARDRGLTVAINWDVWKEVGMAAETAETQKTEPKTRPLNHPLFNSYIDNSQGRTYLSQLSVREDWILKEHRLMGKAMIPGTGFLAMALAAGQEYTAAKSHRQIELKEVYFPTPLIVEDHEEKAVQTILQAKEDEYEFKIVSPSRSDSSQWLEHAIGKIAWSETKSSSTIDLLELESQCDQQKIKINYPEYQPLAGFAEFGLRWSNLKQINIGNNEGLALLELPESFSRDLLEYQLHPALLDIAVHFLSGQLKNEGYYLPFSYKKISIQDSLPAKIYSYAKLISNNSSKNTLKFEIQLFDIWGKELVKIEEYTMRKFNENK